MSAWNKLGICTINGNLATCNEDGTIISDKALVETLLLKELIERFPGRYIVRGSYFGKEKTSIRFVKHHPCQEQWKFSAKTKMLLSGRAAFDLHQTEAKCDHDLESDIARPRPLKSTYFNKRYTFD